MHHSTKHIALLCNPASGNGRSVGLSATISAILKEEHVDHELFMAQWPSDWTRFTEVWIAGGDGTLNYFINHYRDLQLPIALFPGGTGNDLHWLLYGKTAVEDQVKGVLVAQVRWIDAGDCNGQRFVNGVGIGFDGAIVRDLVGKKKWAGKTSYLLSVLKNIVGYRERSYTIFKDGSCREERCLLLSIANGRRYGGGFLVAPGAVPDDGLLNLNIVGAVAPLKRLRYLPLIEKGRHMNLPFVQGELVDSITIQCNEVVPAHIDGEYAPSDRFVIRVLPKCLPFRLQGPFFPDK